MTFRSLFHSDLFQNPARVVRRFSAVNRALAERERPLERWCVMVRDGVAGVDTKVGRRTDVLDLLHALASEKPAGIAANMLLLIARIDSNPGQIPVLVYDADDPDNDTIALELCQPAEVQ